MKRSILRLICFGGLLTTCSALNAQQSLGEQLKVLLSDKTTLPGIMAVVDSFYARVSPATREEGGDGLIKLKQWKRWEWEQSKRVNPDGSLVNTPRMIFDAMAARPRSRAPQDMIDGAWQSIGMIQSSYSADSSNTYAPGQTGFSYANGTGRIDRIAFHPTNSSVIYVGTPYGGLWRTMDSGEHWECLTDTLPSIGISGVVVHPTNPNTLYILTGTADNSTSSFVTIFERTAPSLGVMKSTDAGETWVFTDTFPTSAGVTSYVSYDLVVNPFSPSTLLAATSDGIFRTTNGGSSWTKVRQGVFFDLQFKSGSSTTVYAAAKDSIFFSTNGGATWTPSVFNTNPIFSARIALAASPANTGTVYALCGGVTGTGAFSGIYRSTDSGVNFVQQATTPNILGYRVDGQDDLSQANYDLCIATAPNDANRIVTGGVNAWTSADGGATMTNLTCWFENDVSGAYIHPDLHSMTFNPLDNNLYATSDGGIYVSADLGATWTNLTKGIVVSQFYHMTQFPGSSYKLSGGLQDNGIKYRALGDSRDFVHMHGADGFETAFVANDYDNFYSVVNSGLFLMRYSTGARTIITPGGASGEYFNEVVSHPTDTNVVLYGASRIYRSTNQGSGWTNTGAAGNWSMAISPSSPSRMYAAGGASFGPGMGNVYTSSNSGSAWTVISNNTGFPLPQLYNKVTDIAVNPEDPNAVYVTVGGFVNGSKIFYSADAGQSWANYSFDLPNVVVHSVAVSNNKVFVGTDISLFRRDFGTSTWVDIGDNLPRVPITDILVDPNVGTITVATFGRGAWERRFCVTDITLTETMEGSLAYACDGVITASGDVPGTDNVDSINFTANNKMVLLPGFQARQGTYFKTAFGPCGEEDIPLQDLPPSEPVSVIPNQGTAPKAEKE